jgi:hypothetical protein
MTHDSTVDRMLLCTVRGLAGAHVKAACVAKLEVDPAAVKAAIAKTRKRLTLAAEYNRNELLGAALTRLNDLYGWCIRAGADATFLKKGSAAALAEAAAFRARA